MSVCSSVQSKYYIYKKISMTFSVGVLTLLQQFSHPMECFNIYIYAQSLVISTSNYCLFDMYNDKRFDLIQYWESSRQVKKALWLIDVAWCQQCASSFNLQILHNEKFFMNQNWQCKTLKRDREREAGEKRFVLELIKSHHMQYGAHHWHEHERVSEWHTSK